MLILVILVSNSVNLYFDLRSDFMNCSLIIFLPFLLSEPMSATNTTGIFIPSVFVTEGTGHQLKAYYTYNHM